MVIIILENLKMIKLMAMVYINFMMVKCNNKH
jgi:hypothetical protein